jgi:hypothetical protein
MKQLVLHVLRLSDFVDLLTEGKQKRMKNSKPAILTKNQAWRTCQCLKNVGVKVPMNVRQSCSNSNMTDCEINNCDSVPGRRNISPCVCIYTQSETHLASCLPDSTCCHTRIKLQHSPPPKNKIKDCPCSYHEGI